MLHAQNGRFASFLYHFIFVIFLFVGGSVWGQSGYPDSVESSFDTYDATSETALPSGEGVDPRSPGMQLSAKSEENIDPLRSFADVGKEVYKTQEEMEAEIRDMAFNAAITGLFPMRPGEIRKLLETYDKTQEAVEKPIYPYPKPVLMVETVSLDPGSVPPVIRVAIGHVSTLSILDISGAPWPILDMTWAGDFEIIQPDAGGNILRITPLTEFGRGNLSMTLQDLQTPVIFTLKTQRDIVQYRFDARIPEYGPLAEPPLIERGITLSAGNKSINLILDGTPPENASRLEVSGVDGRTTAYRVSPMIYVRTPLTLLSPGWTSSASSADGMNVYELSDAPVLLLSDKGEVVRARIKGKADTE